MGTWCCHGLRCRKIIETIQEGVFEVDLHRRLRFLNQRTAEILGYAADEVLGQPVFRFVVEEHHAKIQEKLDLRSQPEGAKEPFELKLRGKDNTEIWVMASAIPPCGAHGEQTGSLLLVDASAHRRAESERAQQDRLRGLSAEILRIQDEERRKLARELHESTAQMLTAIDLNLRRLYDAKAGDAPERDLVAETILLARQCSSEIRAMSYSLHPPLLEELGLVTAIRVFADMFRERTGVEVEAKITSSLGRLDHDREVSLFRVVQEALSNVHQHSGSPRALVRLEKDCQAVRLEIQDQGRGFPDHWIESVGILTMRQRVGRFGGQMEIRSSPPGSTVSVVLPLVEPDEEDAVAGG